MNTNLKSREWAERIFLAIIFAGIGSFIMIVFSPWHPLLDRIYDYLSRIVLIAFLLIQTYRKYFGKRDIFVFSFYLSKKLN